MQNLQDLDVLKNLFSILMEILFIVGTLMLVYAFASSTKTEKEILNQTPEKGELDKNKQNSNILKNKNKEMYF